MNAQPQPVEIVAVGPRALIPLAEGRARRRRRSTAYLGQTLGRALLIGVIAYSANREADLARLESTGLAVVMTAAFLPLIQWASQAARTMPLAFGTVTVDAAGALAGFVAASALRGVFPGLAFDTETAAIVGVSAFVSVAVWDTYVRRLATPRTRVLLVGSGDAMSVLLEDLATDASIRPGFRVVGLAGERLPRELRLGPWAHGGLADLATIVASTEPELIVVVGNQNRATAFAHVLEIAGAGFSVVGMPEFYEIAFGRLPVRQLTPAWFMSTLHFYSRPYNRLLKRGFDLGMAIVALVAAIPFLPLIVLLVKRTPGPLIYRQERLGQYGAPFTMLKFRSMVADAELANAAQWALKQDPRVIPGGSLLRRTRLDEIPQLWNVLRGDMSFVGPRPERAEFVRHLELEVPYWSARNLLKPGITGWAQIQAGYTADNEGAEVKLAYDLWYLRHRSLIIDAVICLKTLTTLLTGSGAR